MKAGALVTLVSGGQSMTVLDAGTANGETVVRCCWFDGTQLREAWFPEGCVSVIFQPSEEDLTESTVH